MLAEEKARRQGKLIGYLKEMADRIYEESEIRSVVVNLNGLYSDNFRHNYSDFFPLILDISKPDNMMDLEILSVNLEEIRNFIEVDYTEGQKQFTRLHARVEKLCDHLSLEIGRLNYYSQNEQKLSDIELRNQSMQMELSKSRSELERATQKAASLQTEMIAVLGIFAAIVFTFSGGISYLGNALADAAETPLFRTTYVILLCGFVLFNLVFLLMYMIGKLAGRNIYARCKSDDCTCGANGTPACNGIKRIQKRLPYVFWFNLWMIVLFILNIIIWSLNNCYEFINVSLTY